MTAKWQLTWMRSLMLWEKMARSPPSTYQNEANSANSPAVLVESLTIYWDVLGTAPYAERVMTLRILKAKQYQPFAPVSTLEMPQRIALGMRWHHLILMWLR